MAQREQLKVEKREITGKKVKKIRREGLIPGNIYGKEIESTAVQLPYKDFVEAFKKVHETGLIDVVLEGKGIPVLIHNVQFDPKTQTPIHADFYKVNLSEKITAKIPVVATGEAKAVLDKVGLLEQPMMEIEVEALPTDLPEKIEVNVENLAAVDEQIVVSDVNAGSDVTVLSEPSQVVFKIGELVTKEMEEQAAADEAEAAAAAEETAEGEEGEAKEGEESADGEEKAEGEGGETEEKPSEEAPKE